jgi:FtsP/CotA-like multicopper oxidase with cupredoxin domain
MNSRILIFSFITIVWVIFSSNVVNAKTVRYELTVSKENVNLSGKKTVDWALTVNGSIPAPTLEFTEGDDTEIVVKNNLKNEEVSMHWHGILLPPLEDGVAYVNTPPIFPGQSRVFKFKIRQHGTYWYHSHTMVQEQKGVYGAFIIHPKKETIKADKEIVVVLSDWSDEDANQIIKNLRKDGDYYLYKKDSVRSYSGAIKAGALKNHLKNEWDRMGGMDLSDVGYDAFLINGKRDSQLLVAHPGERIRIRIINAGASSYFYVSLGQLPMQVISADGIDIEPLQAKELLMGMAETYDVLFTVPEHKNFELRATAQDVTGYASGWIGMGEKVSAPNKPQPDFYASMDHANMGHGEMDHSKMDHSKMDHSKMNHEQPINIKPLTGSKVETLTVDELKAKASTTLPKNKNVTDLKLVLGGDMERYIWHINGKAINEDRNILINEGEIVRFTFVNETMMHHPMHLHGHFFRVINKNGEKSPLKHTVDVPPHGTRTIEFYSNEPGQWMLHCHNLYHMKTGMARVVKYMSFQPPPEIAAHEKHDPHLHDHIYSYGLLEASTNHARANFKVMRTWDELDLDLESRSDTSKDITIEGKWDLEGDLFYRRWYGNYMNLIIGGSAFDEKGYGTAGVAYILPMLIETQLLVNHDGKFRLDVEKRFQWTKNVFTEAEFTWRPEWEGDHESEYGITLMYGPSWHWAAGIMATNESLGVGALVKF